VCCPGGSCCRSNSLLLTARELSNPAHLYIPMWQNAPRRQSGNSCSGAQQATNGHRRRCQVVAWRKMCRERHYSAMQVATAAGQAVVPGGYLQESGGQPAADLHGPINQVCVQRRAHQVNQQKGSTSPQATASVGACSVCADWLGWRMSLITAVLACKAEQHLSADPPCCLSPGVLKPPFGLPCNNGQGSNAKTKKSSGLSLPNRAKLAYSGRTAGAW
jgi:hypothetical protein